jgi:biotin transport system substrate-specific component
MEGITMAVTLTTPNTLLGTFAPKSEQAKLVSALLTVVLGTLFITICSKISVPGTPVPVTLQTLSVALLAAAFGWRVGVATVALYIVEGLSGLPVFANGGGAAYVFSPTFGFIVGYLPMAAIIGRAADLGASRRILALFAVMVLADAVVFGFGYAWLVAMSSGAKWIDPNNVMGSAFAKAVQPFIVWDLLKMAFAAVTVTGAWTLLRRKN